MEIGRLGSRWVARAGRRLSIGKALPYMIDIAHGVAELHEHRIVFCDLKPQNVSPYLLLVARSDGMHHALGG